MNKLKLTKSKYIGVYKQGEGFKPWFTHIRFGNTVIKIHSNTERIAAIKYDILAQFFKGKQAKTNKVLTTHGEYRKVVKEVFEQITLPTEQQKMLSTQGVKKYSAASSKHVGVYQYRTLSFNTYYAYICKDKKRYSLGYYPSEDIAGAAYNVAAEYLYPGTTKLNDVDMSIVDKEFLRKILSKVEK